MINVINVIVNSRLRNSHIFIYSKCPLISFCPIIFSNFDDLINMEKWIGLLSANVFSFKQHCNRLALTRGRRICISCVLGYQVVFQTGCAAMITLVLSMEPFGNFFKVSVINAVNNACNHRLIY